MIIGHTHPYLECVFSSNSPYKSGVNFSKSDVSSMIDRTREYAQLTSALKNEYNSQVPGIDCASCIINSANDLNIISYDVVDEKLYKHTNLNVLTADFSDVDNSLLKCWSSIPDYEKRMYGTAVQEPKTSGQIDNSSYGLRR